ncbi:MAG: rhomboid family intramembrane serine protease [Lachnospiraceae bacterium]|nr:rhomboid family intramembrane serine protease [Lachnospiraceae bacterium]
MKTGKMRVSINAPVVLGIVGISFAATLLGYITGGITSRVIFTTYRSALWSPMTYLRAFTHIFGHADWQHFVGNMSYLLLLGPMLEEKYGSRTLAGVVAVTAFSTSFVNYVLFPNVALCGASGVVFAFILLSSFTSFKQGEIPLTFILVSVIFIGQQIFEGIFVRDNVSNLSHIVGGIVGGFLGYEFNLRQRDGSSVSKN